MNNNFKKYQQEDGVKATIITKEDSEIDVMVALLVILKLVMSGLLIQHVLST